MSTSKKKAGTAKRRSKPRPGKARREPIVNVTETTLVDKPDIHAEIQYMIKRAQAEEARIVTLGNLVFFSTWTRDAWLLDTEDNFALCLCRDGNPQPFRVIDSPETFAIEWPASFALDGDDFIVREKSGRVIATQDYPTAEIAAACRWSRESGVSGFGGFR